MADYLVSSFDCECSSTGREITIFDFLCCSIVAVHFLSSMSELPVRLTVCTILLLFISAILDCFSEFLFHLSIDADCFDVPCDDVLTPFLHSHSYCHRLLLFSFGLVHCYLERLPGSIHCILSIICCRQYLSGAAIEIKLFYLILLFEWNWLHWRALHELISSTTQKLSYEWFCLALVVHFFDGISCCFHVASPCFVLLNFIFWMWLTLLNWWILCSRDTRNCACWIDNYLIDEVHHGFTSCKSYMSGFTWCKSSTFWMNELYSNSPPHPTLHWLTIKLASH